MNRGSLRTFFWVPDAPWLVVSVTPMRSRAWRVMRSEFGSTDVPSIEVFQGLLSANGRMIPAADVEPIVVTVPVPGTVEVVGVVVVATVAPCVAMRIGTVFVVVVVLVFVLPPQPSATTDAVRPSARASSARRQVTSRACPESRGTGGRAAAGARGAADRARRRRRP